MERTVEKGSRWRHFKGKHIATVLNVAMHTETEEMLVVYECYDSEMGIVAGVFARPLDMFLADVDSDKYPDAKQKHRFERIE